MDVRAAFVAQREAAEAMQPRQGAFDNLAEDAEAAAMRTTGALAAAGAMDAENAPTALASGDDFKNGQRRRACARLALTRYSQPLPLTGFQTFGDTLCSGRRRIHETIIERQDASAIRRLAPR